MSGWLVGGVDLCAGKTRSGKTSFAIELAKHFHKAWGFPIGVLDMAAASNFANLPHCRTGEEFCDALFIKRASAVWTPRTEEERELFWQMMEYFGGVILIIDEIRKLCKPSYIENGFANAVNMHGHGKLGPSRYILTAQRPKYVHYDLWPAFERVFLFCVAKGRDAKVIDEHLEIPPSVSTTMGRGEYVEYQAGFPPEEGTADKPGEREAGNPADPPTGADPAASTDGSGAQEGTGVQESEPVDLHSSQTVV